MNIEENIYINKINHKWKNSPSKATCGCIPVNCRTILFYLSEGFFRLVILYENNV